MSIPFTLLQEPETRKPSKVRLAFFIVFLLLLIVSAAFIALYIKEKTKSTKSETNGMESDTPKEWKPTHSPTKTCISAACVTSAAEILNKLDQSTKPCDDFYQYSCGGYLKKTHIPEGRRNVDSFSVAFNSVQYALRDILQNDQLMSNYNEGSAVRKTFTYYKSCMKETFIESAGTKPILDEIKRHGSWNITDSSWNGYNWKLEKVLARVLADFSTPAFLSWGVSSSYFDTSKLYVTIGGGISAYDRLLEKKREIFPHKNLKDEDFSGNKEYKTLMSTIFKLLGSTSSTDEEVDRIIKLEKEFKEVRKSITDIDQLKTKVKFMTVAELNAYTSYKFDWDLYFRELLIGTNHIIPSYKKLMVIDPGNIKGIVDWLDKQPKSLLANEIMWNVIRGMMNTLPAKFREAENKYLQSSLGITIPRWERCNLLTDGLFRYVTTLLFVRKHLPEDARQTAEHMFNEIKKQFIDGLEEQKWMDYSTRANARLKLEKMKDLIGFPVAIKKPGVLDRVYKDIQVDVRQLFQNTLNIYSEGFNSLLSLLDKTEDEIDESSRLLAMTYLSINAYYSPRSNKMTVLAGILRPPFYKGDRLKALNYGSLGAVVGHEITHGFDKQGSEFDEKGNLRQWWSKASHKNFVKRSTCLIEEYNKVNIFGYQVNGTQTLSENIADNGGIKYAFRAYQKWRKINGDEVKLPALSFNNDQLFFIAYAQLWCSKYTKEGAKYLMDKDTHSLDPVRVRVPLSNFPEFNKAFGCTPKKDTCTVW